MKRISIIALAFIMLLTSCDAHKFVVKGEPKTIISNSKGRIAVLDDNGQATIKMPKGKYEPLLFATNPDTKETVPFALDYKHQNSYGTSMTIALIFALPTLCISSLIALSVLDDSEIIDYKYLKNQKTNDDITSE